MRLAVFTTLLAALATTPAAAGPVVDEAAKAEALINQGNAVDALLQMDLAVAKLWDETPLTFLEAMFVADKPGGYGVYDPRNSNRFSAGDDMIVYVEMAGYEYRKEGDFFHVEMSVDVEVRHKDGDVLGSQENITQLGLKSRVPNREFFGVLTYNFSGVPAGDYVATTTIHDRATGESAAFDLDFSMQ